MSKQLALPLGGVVAPALAQPAAGRWVRLEGGPCAGWELPLGGGVPVAITTHPAPGRECRYVPAGRAGGVAVFRYSAG